jgi:uncharacterized protein (TIGR03067 family)
MLRVATASLLLLASAALAAGPEGDLKALQGSWVIEAATLAARDHIDDFKGMKLKVTGDKYEIAFAENSDKGTIKLDAAKKPKQIDFTTSEKGPFKGRNLLGIYELRGDTVVVCINSEKPDRPTKFEAPAKSPLMLLTFKREKK